MKILNKIIIAIILSLLLFTFICMPKSLAIKPSEITGEVTDSKVTAFVTDTKDKVIGLISKIATFISVGVLMIIGIKYITGSVEEKASYKKTMLPYLFGCILIFGASIIAPKISELAGDMADSEKVGNTILGLIQVVGTYIAVAVLMILGIKYMMGSTEEKASYKKSMLPYLIGAVLLFGGVNVTAAIVNTISVESETTITCPNCGRTFPIEGWKNNGNQCPACRHHKDV